MPGNGKRLRRLPLWRSQIGVLFATLFFVNNVTKEAVPEGPSDERSEECSADAVLHVWRRVSITAQPIEGQHCSARDRSGFYF